MKKLFSSVFVLFIYANIFAQAQRLVLFEEFTGENCPPCASINPYVDYVASLVPNEVVLIHYLAPVPTPGILSQQVSGLVNGRMGYYGVNSTPWGQQDGAMWDSTLISTDGNNPFSWCVNSQGYLSTQYVDAEYAVPSPFSITVADTLTGASDSFYVAITVTAAEAHTFSGALKLQVAMVENIQYAAPVGTNGESSWSNAVRGMYPSYLGTTLGNTWTNGQTATYYLKGKMPSFIRDKTQVRFVAFIQNTNGSNKNIQQAGISAYYNFGLDVATYGLQGGFDNCFNSQYTPTVYIANTGTSAITTCNIATYLDNVFVDSTTWTGNLASFDTVPYTLNAFNVTAGQHKVTIKLTYPNGQADPNPGNDSISMNINMPVSEASTPLFEGFENGNPIYNGWSIENPGRDSSWALVNVGDTSAHSFMVQYIDDLNNDYAFTVNNLYAPPVDLTHAAHATIKFSFANQWVSLGNNEYYQDSLDIDVSTDCGNTWTTVYATDASTAPTISANNYTAFTPSPTQWKSDTADLTIAANHQDVLIRFRPQSMDGNNLYLDNINIYKYDSVAWPPLAVPAVNDIQSVSVYPNPANTGVNINVQLGNDMPLSYRLTDVAGNEVMYRSAETGSSGVNMFTINTLSLAQGTYFVTVIAGAEKTTKMITVLH